MMGEKTSRERPFLEPQEECDIMYRKMSIKHRSWGYRSVLEHLSEYIQGPGSNPKYHKNRQKKLVMVAFCHPSI